jgi:hypothetical protein
MVSLNRRRLLQSVIAATAYPVAAQTKMRLGVITGISPVWIAAAAVFASLTGDLAAQLGLRLEGEAESNLADFQDFCATRRFHLVLRDLRAPAFTFAGRTSTIMVDTSVMEPRDESIRGIQHALRHQQIWILLSWDRADEARHLDYRRACEFDEQMQLPFDFA